MWVKRAARPALRSRLGFGLLAALAWITRREILRPRTNPGGPEGLRSEAELLDRLRARGVHVPEVLGLADDGSWLALGSLGASIGSQLARLAEVSERRALLVAAARGLGELHAHGFVHGAPLPRNLTASSGVPPWIGFLDFEDHTGSRMRLACAQARDLALLLWGAARWAERDAELLPAMLAAWEGRASAEARAELAALARFARRCRAPLRPFLRWLGGDLRRASLTLDAVLRDERCGRPSANSSTELAALSSGAASSSGIGAACQRPEPTRAASPPEMPSVFADFNNRDAQGRLRLSCDGTDEDLRALGLELREGLVIFCTDRDELGVLARVTFSAEERIWVGEYEERALRRLRPDSFA